MSATATRERVIADSQFGGGAITNVAPATWYLALSTTTPANDGTGFTEPVGGSYARVAITNNATNWPAAATADGVTKKTSGAKFTFPNPTGSWGAVTHWGLFLASTGGTPEWVGALDAPISPKSGNTPVEFDTASLSLVFA
jgi:hypothetical protein